MEKSVEKTMKQYENSIDSTKPGNLEAPNLLQQLFELVCIDEARKLLNTAAGASSSFVCQRLAAWF